MFYTTLEQLAQRVIKSVGPKRIAAVIAPEDSHTLEAVIMAKNQGIIEPVLFGKESVISRELDKLGGEAAQFKIVHSTTPEEAILAAGLAIKEHQAHFLMKGLIQTSTMLKILFAEDMGFRRGKLISHVCLMEIPGHHKLVAVMDGAINISPSLEQKKQMLENTVQMLHSIGINMPKVAILTATEQSNPKMPETLDAAALKAMNKTGEISGCIVEGPLSYDLAMCPESSEVKQLQSPVLGDADVLMCPGIATGNVLIKSLRHSAKAASACLVLGGASPIVLTSRAAFTNDKYWSLVLAASITL